MDERRETKCWILAKDHPHDGICEPMIVFQTEPDADEALRLVRAISEGDELKIFPASFYPARSHQPKGGE